MRVQCDVRILSFPSATVILFHKKQNKPVSVNRMVSFKLLAFPASDFQPFDVYFPLVQTGVSWKRPPHPCEIHLSPVIGGSLKRQ